MPPLRPNLWRIRPRMQRMGGPNLEVFKFAMYIGFPIGIMYYFGTNLDNRFAIDGFWPKDNQTHKIPFEREEIDQELERMKARRLEKRKRRLEEEERVRERLGEEGVRELRRLESTPGWVQEERERRERLRVEQEGSG